MNLNATLLGEMLTFAIFVWFTMRFVIPPIQKVIEERQVMAQDTESNFFRSKAKLESDAESGKLIIEKANSESELIEQDARAKAKAIVQKAEIQAKAAAIKIAKDNEKKLDLMLEQMKSEFKSEFAAKLVALGVQEVLKGNMNSEINLKIVDSVIAEEM